MDGAGADLSVDLGVDLGVDTVEPQDGAGRLGRAADDLRAADEGLERVPVVAVVTGSDAVLDALADLARQWHRLLDDAVAEARGLQGALSVAATEYARAERAAAEGLDLDALLLPGIPTGPDPAAEHPAQDRPAPAPTLGPASQ